MESEEARLPDVRSIAWLDLTRDIGTICCGGRWLQSARDSDGNENTEKHTAEHLLHADREQEWITLHRQWTLDQGDNGPGDSGYATNERGDLGPARVWAASAQPDDECESDWNEHARIEEQVVEFSGHEV